jgi:DNA-binding NarL/FixJ family response regulator
MTLTARERACLELIASGRSNAGIVRDLGLSQASVNRALSALYRKLGAADRASAVARAFRTGLLA